MSTSGHKIENPGLFVFMFLLFWLSVGLITYGVLKGRNESTQPDSGRASDVGVKNGENVGSLSKFFENVQNTDSSSGKDDYYLETDPFKNVCSQNSGGKAPYVVSGIVCYR
jgi:hypothetical protein